jgi:hypothetical protein
MDSKMNVKVQYSSEKSTDGTDTASLEEGRVNSGFRVWARNISLEVGGIERVTDEERQTGTTKVWNACTFW